MDTTERTIPSRDLVGQLHEKVHLEPDLRSAYVAGTRVIGQDRDDLAKRLTSVLYDVFHLCRSPQTRSTHGRREPEVEKTILRALSHRTVLRRSRILSRGRDAVLLQRGGVRVWTPNHRIRSPLVEPEGDVEVELPSFDAAVSPGYLMVESVQEPPRGAPELRFYANVRSSKHVPDVLSSTLGILDALGAPYRVKVCSLPSEFPRTDSLVVYLSEGEGHLVSALVSALDGHSGLAEETSLLALRLGEGKGLALEPTDSRPQARGLSFGLHRCSVLAGALVDAATEGEDTRGLLNERLRSASVDPQHVWRNTGSSELPFVAPTG